MNSLKKNLSFLLKGIAFVALFVGLEQLIELKSKGFCLQKILSSDLPFHAEWETPPLSSDALTTIDTTLNQPFHLIGAGSECYAFESADHKTVIKFFKLGFTRPVYLNKGLLSEDHRHYAGTLSDHWLTQVSLVEPFDIWRKRLLGIREFRITRTFTSMKMAYEELQEETGIFYLHLNPTDYFHRNLTLIDSSGYQHTIDLDSSHFVLQKNATLLEPHFKQLIKNREFAQAHASIDSVFSLILNRCRKGFADRDFMNKNIGFIGNRAIEIDSGSFSKDPKMKDPLAYKGELFFATIELREWLTENSPELLSYYETKLEELIRSES